jgi:two-component system, response regulator
VKPVKKSVTARGPRGRGPQTILLVENDANESVFMTIALEKVEVAGGLHIARNMEQAIAYLTGNGEFSDRIRHPLPVLVLLDLNLPSGTGIDLLKWIREQSQLDTVPVIVLTESERCSDVGAACSLRANSCLVKPSPRIRLVESMALVMDYWLRLNEPSAGRWC